MSVSRLEVFIGTETIQEIWGEVSDPFFLFILLIVIAILLAALIIARRRMRGGEEEIPEKKVRKPADYVLKSGTSYLVAGEKPDLAFGIFSNALAAGASGLCVTRAFPDEVSEEYELGDTPILWLSRDTKRASINPTNLGAIILEVQRFLKSKEDGETIVMLDGLEYLIVQNDFSKVIKFVQNLKDTVSVGGSRLVIPFNLAALEESRQALLTRDLELLE
jgi:two-component system cell cycle response regulator